VDVRVTRDELLVEIRDDGVGGAVVAAGSGLGGLRERLWERGGAIEIRVATEGGVRLVARLPLQPRIRQIAITDLVGTA
jgi:signal transduction histidine kinase